MFDLYLGGDLGLWALEQVPSFYITQIFTYDGKIEELAKKNNIKCYLKNANLVSFNPAKTALSVHYPQIIKPHLIAKYHKIYNLHPAYLPWGRGYYPIFWALWEGSPAGATLHEINAGIDQGDIVAQLQVEYYEDDTGGSLFSRVREAEKKLFLAYWDKIAVGLHLPAYPQNQAGTYHNKKEFFALKTQVNLATMQGEDLIKLIRCLTFDGYTGLELQLGQKSFELSLKLLNKS